MLKVPFTRFWHLPAVSAPKERRMFGHQLMGRSSGFGWWFLLFRVVIVTWFRIEYGKDEKERENVFSLPKQKS